MTYKILVIDDHPETLNIIQRVLQQQGYEVIGARSGVRGLALAKEELPDLILLDVMMPEMDGREVCRRLRATPPLTNVPIILFTALSEADQKLAGFDAGADDYLTKPTEPGELVERVKALLAHVTPRDNKVAVEAAVADEKENSLATVGMERAQEVVLTQTMDLPMKRSVIVVVGARGGVGTTTMAINLAVSTAEADRPTRLLDLDLIQGHIALYLNQKVAGGVNALANLSGRELIEGANRQLINYQDNLQLLLAHPNLLDRHPTLSPSQTNELTEALTLPNYCLVIDAGRGFTPATRPLLERADHVIVCFRPERVALAATRQLLEALPETLLSNSAVHPVLMDFSGGMNVPRSAIEGFLNRALGALVSIQPQELAQSVNKGIPLIRYQPEMKASVLIRQLGQRLLKTERYIRDTP